MLFTSDSLCINPSSNIIYNAAKQYPLLLWSGSDLGYFRYCSGSKKDNPGACWKSNHQHHICSYISPKLMEQWEQKAQTTLIVPVNKVCHFIVTKQWLWWEELMDNICYNHSVTFSNEISCKLPHWEEKCLWIIVITCKSSSCAIVSREDARPTDTLSGSLSLINSRRVCNPSWPSNKI